MPRTDAFFGYMKKTNILSTAREVIYNKYVLYAVFVAALFDLLYSVVKQDYLYCVLFVLVGFVIAFFNKNMTVILTLTIATANILKTVIGGKKLDVEGFGDSEDVEDVDSQPQKNGDNDSTDPKSTAKPEPEIAAKPNAAKKKTAPSATPSAKQTTSPAELVDMLKENAMDLQELQQQIIQGFEQIEPHMNRAETLIGTIQETAQTIQGMRNKQ